MVYIPRSPTSDDERNDADERDDVVVNRCDRKSLRAPTVSRFSSTRTFIRWFVFGGLTALFIFGVVFVGASKIVFSFF